MNEQLSQPQPPAPDQQAEVAQMLAQVEREKTEAKTQIEAAKLDLERQSLEAEFTRKGCLGLLVISLRAVQVGPNKGRSGSLQRFSGIGI